MKKGFLLLLLISILCANSIAQDAAGQKKDPSGKWKFEAPAAEEEPIEASSADTP